MEPYELVDRAGMHVEHIRVTTPDGWELVLHHGVRTTPARQPTPSAASGRGPPVLFVPGFGMNSWIFRFHPRGGSFMEALLDAGLDPWAVDLRGHSTTTAHAGAPLSISLADYAFTDLPTAFDAVARATGRDRVHAIGCSLGGALLYAYGGSVADHRIDRMVAMATPLRWTKASAIVRTFGMLAPWVGFAQLRGTRQLARVGLPVVSRLLPGALSVYLNPRITHTSPSRELVQTVEDTSPRVNRQLAKWIQRTDLTIGGTNVTDALRRMDRPLLVVVGNGDRICPPEAALAALETAGGPCESLVVGRSDEAVSHADLFISDIAPKRVYAPIARFLLGR